MLFLFILMSTAIKAQTYQGYSSNGAYQCSLRVLSDSTVHLVCNSPNNTSYTAYTGTISATRGGLLHISATMTIGQFAMKTWHKDTLYIQLDTAIADQLDKIQIQYANNTYEQLRGYDSMGSPLRLLKVPVDSSIFNNQSGSNYVIITVNRRDYSTGEWLSFKIPFGSAASITAGQLLEFDVLLEGKKLTTAGQPPLQTGHFTLTKKQ